MRFPGSSQPSTLIPGRKPVPQKGPSSFTGPDPPLFFVPGRQRAPGISHLVFMPCQDWSESLYCKAGGVVARPNTQQAVHITVGLEESTGQSLQAFLVSGAVHERHHSIKPGRGGCGGSGLLLPELLVPLNVGVRVLNIFFFSFPSLVCSPPLYLLNIEDLCQG